MKQTATLESTKVHAKYSTAAAISIFQSKFSTCFTKFNLYQCNIITLLHLKQATAPLCLHGGSCLEVLNFIGT